MATGLYMAATDAQVGTPPNDTLAKMPELNSLLDALKGSRMSLVTGAVVCAAMPVSLLVPRFGFSVAARPEILRPSAAGISRAAIFGLGCFVFFSIFSVAGTQFVGPIGLFMLAIVRIGRWPRCSSAPVTVGQLPILSIAERHDPWVASRSRLCTTKSWDFFGRSWPH